MKSLLAASAFGLAMTLAAGAHAQMQSPDANGDGVISKAEQAGASEARFKRMDMNGDGVIDAGELARIKAFIGQRSPQMATMMDRLDANGDGKITHAEFMASSEARFARMDANHDGKLDKGEVDAARTAMGQQ
jgi:Ca2+-binding EF-hand superfamily protein